MYRFASQEIKEFVSKPLFDEKVLLDKDTSYPKISIVTPSYNQGQFLERTILSVLNQNYPNLEYIIIDGGSTDGSVEIIKKYEKYLAYWVGEKDNGQSHAINKGLKMATGDIVAYLNSDDLYTPLSFKIVAKFFTENPGVDMVYSECLIIHEENDVERMPPVRKKISLELLVHGHCCFYQPTVFWTKKILNKVGLFDENLHYLMDRDYWIRVGRNSANVRYIPEYLAVYRFHKTCKSAIKSKSFNFEREVIAKKHGGNYFLMWLIRNGRLIYSCCFRLLERWLNG